MRDDATNGGGAGAVHDLRERRGEGGGRKEGVGTGWEGKAEEAKGREVRGYGGRLAREEGRWEVSIWDERAGTTGGSGRTLVLITSNGAQMVVATVPCT